MTEDLQSLILIQKNFDELKNKHNLSDEQYISSLSLLVIFAMGFMRKEKLTTETLTMLVDIEIEQPSGDFTDISFNAPNGAHFTFCHDANEFLREKKPKQKVVLAYCLGEIALLMNSTSWKVKFNDRGLNIKTKPLQAALH